MNPEEKQDAIVSYKPKLVPRVERTVNGKKWSTLTPRERFRNRPGVSNGRPQEKGLEIVSPEFDILTGIRGLTNMTKKVLKNPSINKSVALPLEGTYMPNELEHLISPGREFTAKFFLHPVVKQSYAHNQKLAKRIGAVIPDRPTNISELVNAPIKVNYQNLDDNTIALLARSSINDTSKDILTYNWLKFNIPEFKLATIHEFLHRGNYSAPLKARPMLPNYYNEVFKPEYSFYKWKTNKLFNLQDDYLTDILSGEAGPNLIDLGRDLGIKLGLKYPGYNQTKSILLNYTGNKSFIVPKLNNSRAGLRHVWDAMSGKYFTAPVIAISNINKE